MSIYGNAVRALTVGFVLLAAGGVPTGPADAATQWQVVPEKSTIGFAGTHAGRAFNGTFKTWTAEIAFDPKDLAGSKAKVTVDLASAATGDATYDKTLPTADWFNVAQIPQGTFTTASIKDAGDGKSFTADGSLSIRGVEVPVTLDFTFSESGEEARIEGKTSLKRMAFGIGKGSDADGAWVSLDIPVTVSVTLKRAP